jgi:hypothetical protein
MDLRDSRAQIRSEARRRLLLRALASGALVGGLGWRTEALASWFGGVPGRMPEGRSIFDMRGEVQVNGRRADYATRIAAGDHITTGEGAYVITAVGQTAFVLRESSALEIGGRELFVRSMQLLSGAMLAVFGRRKPEDAIRINTPLATIGIRGTGLYAESEADQSYVCTCYGTTDIASALDSTAKVSVTSTHHDAAQYVLKDPENGRRILPAPFKNHTDLELMTIEALVGRKVPFGLQVDEYESPRRDY